MKKESSKAPDEPQINIIAKYIVCALAAIHLIIAASLAYNRITSPAILDSAEAIHSQFAYQVGAGLPLYGKMDINVQELWYNPLAFQVAGYASKPFNYNIRAMRLVMFFFGAGSILLAAMITWHMTGSRFMAFIAAAWMSAIDAGPWIVEVGPNAGHVFFAMLGAFLLIRDKSLKWPTVIMASVALFGSFWCKQTGLAYIAAGVFYVFTQDVRKGFVAALTAVILIASGILYYTAGTDSTYLKYTFMHGNHPIMWQWLWTPALYPELLGRFGILCSVIITALFLKGLDIRKWFKPETILLGASAAVGIFTRIKYGSGATQALFFYGMIIVSSLYYLNKFLSQYKISGALIAGMLAVQTVTLAKDWRPFYITSHDETRFREILNILAEPGKVAYYANHGIYNLYVGKEPFAAMGRDCWHKGVYDRSLYPEYYRKTLTSDPFDIVIIDIPLEDNSWLLYERLQSNYQPVMELPAMEKDDLPLRKRKIVFRKQAKVNPKNQLTETAK